jgi:microcystin-dependent protein
VNFGLPDLQSRVPIHMGSGHTLGERGGEQGHTLSISEIPTHTHTAKASTTSDTSNVNNPASNILAGVNNLYAVPAGFTSMIPATLANVGGSQAHLNMQPFLTLNFSIALQGIFPSQT